MKFTEGMWKVKEGVTPEWGGNVFKTIISENNLRLLLTKPLQRRGDTLNTSTLTVDISTPSKDIISVKSVHWAGRVGRGPYFDLNESQTTPKISQDSDIVTFKSGDLSARVNKEKNNFTLSFLDAQDAKLTGHSSRSLGYMKDRRDHPHTEGIYRGHTGYISANLDIAVGETIYGFGERFGPFIKNGQTVDIWNEDGGTSSELAYKNIPFYLTSKGYGILVRHAGRVSFEVQSERTTRCNISVQDEELEYLIIYGPSPKDILQKYTALTGRPPLPPSWSYGLWLTTSFTTDYDETTVSSFLDGFAQRNIPLGVFHFDCFWMRGLEWCNFEFDPEMFPDPNGYLARLQKDRGLHICVWINSYIGQESALFQEGMQGGYFIKREDGTVYQWDNWQAGMAFVDFTNPKAWKWYQSYLERLVNIGVTSFKTDFGERVPFSGVKFYDGSDPLKMHNYYTLLYNRCVHEVLENKLGPGKGCLFARSATVGGQTMPVHWGGDCESTFEAMAETLRGGLSLGLCGFGFWAHDIGGFEGTPAPALYKRWVQFGLLSSHSRLHGSSSYRVPWIYDDEACDILKQFTQLKISLAPYLFRAAVDAHKMGTPMVRPMLMEFPEDRNVWALDRQYMFGPSLLVAPVFAENGYVSFYVPDGEGEWVNLLNGNKYFGGKWYEEVYDFKSLPLLVRPNSLIMMNRRITHPADDIKLGLEVIFGNILRETTVAVYDGEGNNLGTIVAKVVNGKIVIENEDFTGVWIARNVEQSPINSHSSSEEP